MISARLTYDGGRSSDRYIVFGVIAGGIFFEEFRTICEDGWIGCGGWETLQSHL
jgi:hypothetical protein